MQRCQILLLVLIFAVHLTQSSDPEIEAEEIRARDFMTILNKETEEDDQKAAIAQWDYATTLNDETLKKQIEITAENAEKHKVRWKELVKFNWKSFTDPSLKRQFMLQSILDSAALSKDEVTRFEKIVGDMEKTYSTATICDYKNKRKCDLALSPDIEKIFAYSRDEKELRHAWISWRNVSGAPIRNLYRDYVHLYNKAAHLNGFNSTEDMWLFPYQELDDLDFKSQLKSLWEQLKPLYQQLHAYIRYKLRQKYGDVVSENGPIPAHLLGNMWGQSWGNIAEDFKPFPNAVQQEVTENLKKENFTVEKIFKTAEDFFVSLGLSPMVDSFWQKSILVKPTDRNIVCHASAWDFYNGKDFRIKMCTTLTSEDLYVVHHEMGHIEYFMQYKDQPYTFRNGANPGFHEAVGDLIALSVESPKHLQKLRLSSAPSDNHEAVLNNLFEVGMNKIPVLPFTYMIDLWRWDVFSGKTSFEDYNCKWWELRESLQGLEPPVSRSENDFDPGSKYHIPANVEYLRYFVAAILEFQFHRALCEKAGQYDANDPLKPLHMCDIYGNKEVGSVLKEMLKMGASKPWPEVLHFCTGQKVMDASAILEFFRPLLTWLEKENRKNNVNVGWDKSAKACTKESL